MGSLSRCQPGITSCSSCFRSLILDVFVAYSATYQRYSWSLLVPEQLQVGCHFEKQIVRNRPLFLTPPPVVFVPMLTPSQLQVVSKAPWLFGASTSETEDSYIFVRIQAFLSKAVFAHAPAVCLRVGLPVVGFLEPSSGSAKSAQLVGWLGRGSAF